MYSYTYLHVTIVSFFLSLFLIWLYKYINILIRQNSRKSKKTKISTRENLAEFHLFFLLGLQEDREQTNTSVYIHIHLYIIYTLDIQQKHRNEKLIRTNDSFVISFASKSISNIFTIIISILVWIVCIVMFVCVCEHVGELICVCMCVCVSNNPFAANKQSNNNKNATKTTTTTTTTEKWQQCILVVFTFCWWHVELLQLRFVIISLTRTTNK